MASKKANIKVTGFNPNFFGDPNFVNVRISIDSETNLSKEEKVISFTKTKNRFTGELRKKTSIKIMYNNKYWKGSINQLCKILEFYNKFKDKT